MARYSIATPCPILAPHDSLLNKGLDDTTTTLNFTSALTSSFQGTKPKRKQRSSVSFAIHEDAETTRNEDKISDNTLLRPARRLTGTFTISQTALKGSNSTVAPPVHAASISSRLSQAPRRPPNRLSIVPESAVKEHNEPVETTQPQESKIKAVRPVRRGTIYIPNEDTTMPSMFMGVFSPLKNLEASAEEVQDATTDLTGIAAQMAAKRGRSRRISVIDTAPRRAPLQTSTRMLQEKAVVHDRPGQGGGKENLPPGGKTNERQDHDLHKAELDLSTGLARIRLSHRRESWKSRETSLYAPTASTAQKVTAPTSSMASSQRGVSNEQRKVWNSGPRTVATQNLQIRSKQVQKVSSPNDKPIRAITKIPSRFVIPSIKAEPVRTLHAVLPDDISNPTLYEENWLGHQEVALTQLINKIFSSSQPRMQNEGLPLTLTQQLLEVYNTTSIALMHNRTQAALLYGALGIPQDILDQGDTWFKDIGRKQAFIRLWIDNYSRSALESGLEVVTGRTCRSQQACRTSNPSSPSSTTKRMLFTFIESFLIRNEDSTPPKNGLKRAAWSYQRTILRSLMLIKALDMIKTCKLSKFAPGLFLSSATYKSSMSILQALFQLMNPSAGDPVRALNYIGYQVDYTQYPLEDYSYGIENLAVELRDGVRLTRLVELLLFPSASQFLDKNQDADATTLLLPAGDSIDFQNGQDWPLSQHMKFPCLSRVARLWNVQIALSAVVNVKGMASMVEGITAEDVVDGFREKTIRLLWALVGKCGLASLIDWEDVRWETRRLRLGVESVVNYSCEEDECFDIDEEEISHSNSNFYSFETCKALLKRWVRAVAATRAVRVDNFTTSFADGRVFKCIVDTYEPFLTAEGGHSSSSNTNINTDSRCEARRCANLSETLLRLGCSQQFAELFSTSTSQPTHIFDRDFVLASLAFLCSRLLAPSKAARAATVIQKRWRTCLSKIEKERNVVRKGLAGACAEFVNSRQHFGGGEGKGERGVDGRAVRERHVLTREDYEEDDFDKSNKEEKIEPDFSISCNNNDSVQSPVSADIWLSL